MRSWLSSVTTFASLLLPLLAQLSCLKLTESSLNIAVVQYCPYPFLICTFWHPSLAMNLMNTLCLPLIVLCQYPTSVVWLLRTQRKIYQSRTKLCCLGGVKCTDTASTLDVWQTGITFITTRLVYRKLFLLQWEYLFFEYTIQSESLRITDCFSLFL